MPHARETLDNRSDAATICLNLAEILIIEDRYADAEELLVRAKNLLDVGGNEGLWSCFYRYQADLARKQGRLEEAAGYAAESVNFAQAINEKAETGNDSHWRDPIRTYAEALHAAAQIEEALGHTAAADKLFEEAIAQINRTTLPESISEISFSYAEALSTRGVFDLAVEYYRAAAMQRAPDKRRLP